MKMKNLIVLLFLSLVITSFDKSDNWYLLETKSYKILFPKKPVSSTKDGKLLSEKVVSLGKYPGREVRIDYLNGVAVIKMRFYLVRNTTFMIQTITDTKKQDNESINKFMNSFQLTN